MDGNFAAEHQRMKYPEEDVWMSDGNGYFVGRKDYQEHLKTGKETNEVCAAVEIGGAAHDMPAIHM